MSPVAALSESESRIVRTVVGTFTTMVRHGCSPASATAFAADALRRIPLPARRVHLLWEAERSLRASGFHPEFIDAFVTDVTDEVFA